MRTRENFRAILRIFDIPLMALAAGGLFFLSIYFIVVQGRVMPVTRERMVEVKKFLDRQSAEKNYGDVYFLGSSVLLEGIDCDIIDRTLPHGLESYNLALMGAGPPQWLLLAPSLKRIRPSLIVLCADLAGITGLASIPEDGLAIAGWWEFVPGSELNVIGAYLSEREYKTLHKLRLLHLLTFRIFPIGAFDMYMREVSRPDLRYEGYTTNFKAPWVRRERISLTATKRWIRGKLMDVKVQTPEDMAIEVRIMQGIIDYFREAGVKVVIVLTPVNPLLSTDIDQGLKNQVENSLTDLAGQNNIRFFNNSNLLPEEYFADYGHPFESGRILWSEVLGDAIHGTLLAAAD